MADSWLPERAENETQKAYSAFLDYCRLGAGRSLRGLQQRYSEPGAETEPPTKNENTLFAWSSKYGWQERVAEYDATIAAERETRLAEQRKQIEDDELLDYERELTEWRRRYDLLMMPPSSMGVFELATFFKLRKEIADLGRRAVGLPEKITKGDMNVDGKVVLGWLDDDDDGNAFSEG